MSRRAVAFVVLAVACAGVAVASAAIAVIGAQGERRAAGRAVAEDLPRAREILGGRAPFVVYRSVDRHRAAIYGRLTTAPLERDGTPGAGALAGPACARAAFAGGRGLGLDTSVTGTNVEILDRRLTVVHSIDLAGVPSRARVSPSGRWGGVTAFLVGHAYATPGTFSTAATIVDMARGKVVGDLEKDFKVTNAGHVVDARDRNYWGLTFAADEDTFYATLATGSKTWLIQGSIRARTAHTIHENVECPALSPDGTRIAYKKAVGHKPTVWHFTVLDLRTGRETPLAEPRSIDDQAAWLDDGHVIYSDGEQTYVVPADGSGRPRLWLRGADSATVRGAASPAPALGS